MALVFDTVWWCATSLHDSPPICFPSERWFSIILSTNTVNILLVPLDPVLSSTHSKYCTLCSYANSSTSSFSTSFSSWEDVVPTSKITNLCGAFYNKNRWRKNYVSHWQYTQSQDNILRHPQTLVYAMWPELIHYQLLSCIAKRYPIYCSTLAVQKSAAYHSNFFQPEF